MRLHAIAILLIIAVTEARGDSLVVDSPGLKFTYVGLGLAIYEGGIYIEATQDDVETTDVIFRSSFDTSYWSIQIQYPSGLAEGRGWCVLTHGAPDAYLLCDNFL